MCRLVGTAWDYGGKSTLKPVEVLCVVVGVGRNIFASEPVVCLAMWVDAAVELFDPFSHRSRCDFYAIDVFALGNVDVVTHPGRQFPCRGEFYHVPDYGFAR